MVVPVLASFVHVLVLLHHDGVGRRDVNDDPDRKEITAGLLHESAHGQRRRRSSNSSYCAVLVRMDVSSACSSVRVDGTLVVQSVPLGGLLTGLGCGISGLRSSGSWNTSDRLLVHNNPLLSHQWRGSVKETSRGRNRETL